MGGYQVVNNQFEDTDDIYVKGATDDTQIGNVSDSLKIANTHTSIRLHLDNNQIFSAAVKDINMPSAGASNPLILFRNPTSSGIVAYIISITCGIHIENNYATFSLYATPTVTANGTTLTNYQRNVGNSPSNGSVLTTYTPTISANGNLLSVVSLGQNTNSLDLISKEFIVGVQENKALLVTGDPKSNNRPATITVTWVEV